MKKSDFVNEKALPVVINGTPLLAKPRKFSTGSVGYNVNGKVNVLLSDGTIAKLQVSGNLTVVGSKDWPQGEATPEQPQADVA